MVNHLFHQLYDRSIWFINDPMDVVSYQEHKTWWSIRSVDLVRIIYAILFTLREAKKTQGFPMVLKCFRGRPCVGHFLARARRHKGGHWFDQLSARSIGLTNLINWWSAIWSINLSIWWIDKLMDDYLIGWFIN